MTKVDKQISLQQVIQGLSGVILCCVSSVIGVKGYAFAVFSCIAAVVLALISLVNGILIIKNTWEDKEIGKWEKTNQYIWAILCFGYVAVIMWFQLYDFVHI